VRVCLSMWTQFSNICAVMFCQESEMSLKCLLDNDYDHDKCALYFQNYRSCHNFWVFLFFLLLSYYSSDDKLISYFVRCVKFPGFVKPYIISNCPHKAVARIFARGDSPSPSLPIPSLPTPLLPSPLLLFPPPSRGPTPLPARESGGVL